MSERQSRLDLLNQRKALNHRLEVFRESARVFLRLPPRLVLTPDKPDSLKVPSLFIFSFDIEDAKKLQTATKADR